MPPKHPRRIAVRANSWTYVGTSVYGRAMDKRRKALTLAASVAALAGGASLTLAPPASAAGGKVPYNGACGSGYSVVDHKDIDGIQTGEVATVYLTYNGVKNCVITITFKDGYKYHMKAAIKISGPGGGWVQDDGGDYLHYAGPVYTPSSSAGQCVDWYGGISGIYAGENNSHCG